MSCNPEDHPPDWPVIAERVKERAGWRCEWCSAISGRPHPKTGTTVVLSAAHINHDPSDDREEMLRALCQRCHLGLDADHHRRTAHRRRRVAMSTPDLFSGAG
jgi:hypothetical protein